MLLRIIRYRFVSIMKQHFQLKAFSQAIRQKRLINLNIGIREAAKQIGVSPATLSRCENENIPTVLFYANICKWLDIPMETFFTKTKRL